MLGVTMINERVKTSMDLKVIGSSIKVTGSYIKHFPNWAEAERLCGINSSSMTLYKNNKIS